MNARLIKHNVFGENGNILAVAKDGINFFQWDTLGFLDEWDLCETMQVLAFGHYNTVKYSRVEYAQHNKYKEIFPADSGDADGSGECEPNTSKHD